MNLKEIKIEELYEKHGIPLHDAQVFQKVAKEQRAVIMTRTPGLACGMLLEQGYDAKSFWVKSKSCSWGPMAGFVCLDPMLNKSMIKGALDNMAYATHSLTEVYENVKTEVEAEYYDEKIKYDYKEGKSSDTIQIRIYAERVNWILANKDKLKNGTSSSYEEVFDEDGKSVGWLYKFQDYEILIKKSDNSDNPKYYDLYYDVKKLYGISENSTNDIYKDLCESFEKKILDFIKDDFDEKTKKIEESNELESEKIKKRAKLQDDREKALDKLKNNNAKFWGTLSIRNYFKDVYDFRTFAKGRFKNFKRLRAMTNAHKPYKLDENAHLNALTGDYDLFAVWPYTISIEKKDKNGNVVLDENGKVIFEYEYDENLDVRVAGMMQNLDDKELIKKEGEDDIGKVVGNITDRVYLIGQLINSTLPFEEIKVIDDPNSNDPKKEFKIEVTNKPLKDYIGKSSKLEANRVYHSDEAGRPFVKSVDSAVGFGPDGEVFEITAKNAVNDLSNAIVYFHHKGYKCFVNKGWKGHLTETVQAYVKDNKSLEKPNKFNK
ncbi:MAG: anthrax toxin-like adenylyl cyclase domain-containing protein [Emticicia sp.]|uniref:anthrax toxin-like adenylyl cyclase domain-containing protein n=1 Tax=Emticicia sp. TaxID=1930953 RepID=UPI003BA6E27C